MSRRISETVSPDGTITLSPETPAKEAK